MKTLWAHDQARDILQTELKELKEKREKLGDPKNWTGAILRDVIDLKISAFERELRKNES